MTYKADILLGRVTKIHGFEGAVTIRLEKTFTEKISDMESVFLEIEGKPVPFFISESEYPGEDILRLKFTGYESIDKVSMFTGCRVLLTSGISSRNFAGIMSDLRGYQIKQSGNNVIGTIKEILENPGQLLLIITNGTGRELLIPLHEDFISKIDNKKKVITMDLPEGLTEIN